VSCIGVGRTLLVVLVRIAGAKKGDARGNAFPLASAAGANRDRGAGSRRAQRGHAATRHAVGRTLCSPATSRHAATMPCGMAMRRVALRVGDGRAGGHVGSPVHGAWQCRQSGGQCIHAAWRHGNAAMGRGEPCVRPQRVAPRRCNAAARRWHRRRCGAQPLGRRQRSAEWSQGAAGSNSSPCAAM
jgi:hypothetical protein